MTKLTKRVYLTDIAYDELEELSKNENLHLNKMLDKIISSYKLNSLTEFNQFILQEKIAPETLNVQDKNKFEAINKLKSAVNWYVRDGEIWGQIESNDYHKFRGNSTDPEILGVVCNIAQSLNLPWRKDNYNLYVPFFIAIALFINHPGNFGVDPIEICEFILTYIIKNHALLEGEFSKQHAYELLKQHDNKYEEAQKYAEERLKKILGRIDVILPKEGEINLEQSTNRILTKKLSNASLTVFGIMFLQRYNMDLMALKL
jgi:FtsZ-binding cell division protein ZapB